MKKEKKFKPKQGQVDFTHIRWAPVLNCVVMHKGKILLIKRSASMRLYPGYWNSVGGFLDDNKSLKEKVEEELREELGIRKSQVTSMRFGQVFDQDEPKYKKTWIVHPVCATVKTNKVVLDWEGEEYRWVTLKEAKRLKLLPGFRLVLKALKI
jgi:ADP-ribose pyrophosphatase YjhB (NUDIX family)